MLYQMDRGQHRRYFESLCAFTNDTTAFKDKCDELAMQFLSLGYDLSSKATEDIELIAFRDVKAAWTRFAEDNIHAIVTYSFHLIDIASQYADAALLKEFGHLDAKGRAAKIAAAKKKAGHGKADVADNPLNMPGKSRIP
jgi:hypothetical protein